MRAKTALGSALAAALVLSALLVRRGPAEPSPAPAGSAPPPGAPLIVEAPDDRTDSGDRRLTMPTGAPTMLTCDEGRRIVSQARTSLAGTPPPVDAEKLGEATADWLDPHGLWSVAPDTPAGPAIKRAAADLLAELEAPVGSGPCKAALAVGGTLSTWSVDVRRAFDDSFHDASGKGRAAASNEVWSAATSSPFESGAVTRNALDLARDLGRSAGVVASGYGHKVESFTLAARDRVAPDLGEEGWARAVIAAAVRAYVPQLDAHGAWAPLDEELSIYDLDLEVDPPERVWTEMTRTAIGARIDKGALAPLQNGDVVLRIHDVALAGVSVEQAEQLAVVTDAPDPHVLVLRPGVAEPLDLAVALPMADGVAATPPPELPIDLVRYGDGKVAIVAIPDVPDDLGARLQAALDRVRETPNVRGLLVDLRGNGGGSTDGAADALSLFLPGVPLFPMKRRDGGIETERARVVPIEQQWTGPVGVLVDGDSASAAEMIAGALFAYHRGVIVGDRTYGKGCAQEYLDDDARAGVLRLTTLLYALPDGSPVQKTGISPEIKLSLPDDDEAEAKVARALDPWRGPDVRDPMRIREVPWRSHGGRVGPCRDEVTCRALRALGATPAASR
ncbi:MAG: S41 family peptidase [Polyangiaceae bacterium]